MALPAGVTQLGTLKGASGTIDAASAIGIEAGSAPTIDLAGTPSSRVLSFGIPRGDKGEKGTPGLPGAESLPTNEAVAEYIATEGESATKTAISAVTAAAGTAAARVMQKIRQDTADVNFVINSDSTGDMPYRWPRELALLFAAAFPSRTVQFVENSGGPNPTYPGFLGGWTTPEAISTGTGSYKIIIWNGAISGATLATHQVMEKTMYQDTSPDLIFVSQGHNEGAPTATNTFASFRARYLAAVAAIQRAAPGVPIITIGQNPPLTTTTNDMIQRVRHIAEVAQMLGLGFIDVCQPFLDSPDQATLYDDNIHPNAAGGQLWARVVWEAIYATRAFPPAIQALTSLNGAQETNLLTNGDWTQLGTDGTPSGWTAIRATVSKDTTNPGDNPNGWALKLVAQGGGQSMITQSLSAAESARLRGRTITLMSRVRNNGTAADQLAGNVQLIEGAQVVAGIGDNWTYGGYTYRAVTIRVGDAATSITARVYATTGTTAGADVTVEGAWLIEGSIPKKAAHRPAVSNAGFEYVSTLGNHPANGISAPLASTVHVAGSALVTRIKPSRDTNPSILTWWAGAASAGNYDIGIYTSAGVRIWSKGSTAWPAANAQVGDAVTGVTLTAGIEYLIVLASSGAGSFMGVTEPKNGIGNLLTSLGGSVRFMRSITQAIPLPATITPGNTAASSLPAIVLSGS